MDQDTKMKIQRIPQPKLDALLLNHRRKKQAKFQDKHRLAQNRIMKRKMELAKQKSERQAQDGEYKYRYNTPQGRATVSFTVFNGIIQTSSYFLGPVTLYINRHLTDFENARNRPGWKWQFDSLTKEPKPETTAQPDRQA